MGWCIGERVQAHLQVQSGGTGGSKALRRDQREHLSRCEHRVLWPKLRPTVGSANTHCRVLSLLHPTCQCMKQGQEPGLTESTWLHPKAHLTHASQQGSPENFLASVFFLHNQLSIYSHCKGPWNLSHAERDGTQHKAGLSRAGSSRGLGVTSRI